MTTLSWPSLSRDPTRFEWWLQANVQEHVSPFTGTTQTQELPGAYWVARIEYVNVQEADARLLWSLLMRLRGRAGRVFVPQLGRPVPLGAAGGSPLVMGAGQTGVELDIDGGPLSTAGWLVAGDFIGVSGKLYMVTDTVTTNGAGEATIPVAPPILSAPADNAAVTLTSPVVEMMLTDDRQGWTYEPGLTGYHSFAFDLREAF